MKEDMIEKDKSAYWMYADSYEVRCEEPNLSNSDETDTAVYERNQLTINSQTSKIGKKGWLQKQFGPLSIEQLLYQYPTCPPSAFMNIKELYKNPNVKYTKNSCKKAEVVVRNWCVELNGWKFEDYEKYYNDKIVKPYFNTYNRIQDQVYFDIEQSIEIAHELLLYQCNNNTEAVYEFLNDLLNIID